MRALFVFVCLMLGTQANSQGPLFAPAPGPSIHVGKGSGTTILADVSGDGHLDLITRHLMGRCIKVLIGDGKGRFSEAAGSPIALAYPPGDIKLADVNGDRIADLGVSNSERDSVDIFLATGKGGFTLAAGSPFTASASVEFFTRFLRFVDINEDRKLDIITATDGRNTRSLPSLLLGDGRGGFLPGPVMKVDLGQGQYSFAFGDTDRDGHLDFVTVSNGTDPGGESGRVTVQRGDGKGGFKTASASSWVVKPAPRLGTLADVNGDQRLDMVLSHTRSNLLNVLLNGGDGSFAPAPGSPYSLSAQAFETVVVDVNRDGRSDLVIATVDSEMSEGSVTVLLGDGRGFVSAPGSPFRAGQGGYFLAVGDVNEDGKPDVVVSSFEGTAVTLLLGR